MSMSMSPDELRRAIASTTTALVTYLRDGPDDETSRSMRQRLATYKAQLEEKTK